MKEYYSTGHDYKAYFARIAGTDGNGKPEVLKITDDPVWYLKYKFLGLDGNNNYVGSAWVIPFWVGLASWVFSKLPLGSKMHRIQKPLNKFGKATTIVSTIGALALPGSDMVAGGVYPTGVSGGGQGIGPYPKGGTGQGSVV